MKITRISTTLAVALAACLAWSGSAAAQSAQEQARILYQEGNALFQSGQYAAAIDKFSAADKLAPAPLLDFNIGLAYEQLGDGARALRHYRSYLSRAPTASNRDAVQARINRIEGELREESKRAAEETRRAEEARKAEEARAAEVAPTTAPAPTPAPPVGPAVTAETTAEDMVDPGTADPPAATGFAPTGDPELDRVAQVDVTALRDQRGVAGTTAPRTASADAPPPPPAGAPAGPIGDGEKKSKPAYKQWWFWVVIGVSAVILIDIASSGNDNAATRALDFSQRDRGFSTQGPAVFRF